MKLYGFLLLIALSAAIQSALSTPKDIKHITAHVGPKTVKVFGVPFLTRKCSLDKLCKLNQDKTRVVYLFDGQNYYSTDFKNDKIGHGKNGEAYKAHRYTSKTDSAPDCVVLKISKTKDVCGKRQESEVEALRRMDLYEGNQFQVTYRIKIGAKEQKQTRCIVPMRLGRGIDLKKLLEGKNIRVGKTSDEKGSLQVAMHGAFMLSKKAFGLGIIHADFHIGNILFDKTTGLSTLIDFGNAVIYKTADAYEKKRTSMMDMVYDIGKVCSGIFPFLETNLEKQTIKMFCNQQKILYKDIKVNMSL